MIANAWPEPEPEGFSTLFPRLGTGNPQLDTILCGGFPTNSINIVMGQPGTGKTILAEQLVYHQADEGRRVVFAATLSEPMTKVVSYVQRFAFYDEAKLAGGIQYEDIGSLLAENGPAALVPWLTDVIKTRSPKIVVIDSFRAIHDLASSPQEVRLIVSQLAGILSAYAVTSFLLGEYSREDIPRFPEFAVADAIVELARQTLSGRDERFIRVLKLRGSSYREGQHAFRITGNGIELYPRLVTPDIPETYEPALERVSTGVEGLDDMLDGGLWRGSTTLLTGPTGSGKTTVSLQFALEGARVGENVLYVHFQENPSQLKRSLSSLEDKATGEPHPQLRLQYASPVELQIDSIIVSIFESIKARAVRRVVIDAVGDLATAASDAQRLHDYLYSLVQHFAVAGVTSLLVFECGESHTGPDAQEQRFSYMSDNVIHLGHRGGDGPRTIRVVKTRNSAHDESPHVFEIGPRGGRVT